MKEIHSTEEFKTDILLAKGWALVDFKTSWCRHCKLMAPLVEEAEEKRGDIFFASVDIEENPAMARTFNVMGTPTFIAFYDGKEKGRIIGYNQKSTFEKEMENIFGK